MSKKTLDFEINLMPVISLLAVCISFLLLTAVWIPLGSLGVKQSVGTAESDQKKDDYSLWVQFEKNNKLTIYMRDSAMQKVGKKSTFRLSKRRAHKRATKHIGRLFNKYPSITSAIVAPLADTSFDQVIKMMDQIKSLNKVDVGVAPI